MPNNSKPNSLITEKSPLSAPTRPQPRKLAPFEKAKRLNLNKPVLVSIGYSTCH